MRRIPIYHVAIKTNNGYPVVCVHEYLAIKLDFFFGLLLFGDVDTGADDVLHLAIIVQQNGIRPGDQPALSVFCYPVIFRF